MTVVIWALGEGESHMLCCSLQDGHLHKKVTLGQFNLSYYDT